MDAVFNVLNELNDLFLGFVALFFILSLGSYFTLTTRFYQFRNFPRILREFILLFRKSVEAAHGVHPLRTFFASVGGMIGIGNVVAVTTAITIGGPGALLWVWVAGLLGCLIKYAEIYLGHKHRRPNDRGGYDGGPMFFLQSVYPGGWIAPLMSVLMCIYGTEIYQFSVIVHSVSTNFSINRLAVALLLLVAVFQAALGGVARVGRICAILMPFFTGAYLCMSGWIILSHPRELLEALALVFRSALSPAAVVTGGIGGGWIAIQQGMARAAYSADIGIGYDSIIQSESRLVSSVQQAQLSLVGVFTDNLVCSASLLLVLVTGVWKQAEVISPSHLVQQALSQSFPGMQIFMPLFLFVLGYTTVISYLCVCFKCSSYLSKRYGVMTYTIIAIPTFLGFSFLDQSKALLVMSLTQSLLLAFNLSGIFLLRHELRFKEVAVTP